MAVAATALLCGCFFETPLDPSPKADMDRKLLGTWRCVPFNSEATEEAATFSAKTGALFGDYCVCVRAKETAALSGRGDR